MTESKIKEVEPEEKIKKKYWEYKFGWLLDAFNFYRFGENLNDFPNSLLETARKYAHNQIEAIILKRELEDLKDEHSEEILERLRILDEKEKEEKRQDEKDRERYEREDEIKRQYNEYLKEKDIKNYEDYLKEKEG